MKVIKSDKAETKETIQKLIEKEKELSYPLDKFPRIKHLLGTIEEDKELVECLNLRMTMLTEQIENPTNETAFELNEKRITVLNTNNTLKRIHGTIHKKKTSIKEFEQNTIRIAIDEIDANWDNLLINANIIAKKDKNLKQMLEQPDYTLFDSNWEYKFGFYLNLKDYIYPSKKK